MTKLSQDSPRFLIIAPGWVGDIVMSQALYRALKLQYPEALLDVLVAPAYVGLVERMPEVHQVIPAKLPHGQLGLKTRWRLGRTLRQQGYDRAFILPNSWKSALIPWFAGIPKRRGFLGEMRWGLLNDVRKLDKLQLPKMVQRFVALAFDRRESWDRAAFPWPSLQAFPRPSDKPVLALAPGAAFGNSKRWPASHFASVAQHYLARSWSVWVLGGPDDEATLSDIGHKAPGVEIFGGSVSLADKIDLLASAQKVVSNDSGLLHIAAAVKRPVVAIYGSTSPAFTPPLSDHIVVLEAPDVSCRPCFKRNCPLSGAQHLQCLTLISPERVLSALETLS